MEISTLDETIDDTWIHEFNKLEKVYDNYYKDKPSSVDALIFFMNRRNEVERIKKERVTVKNNIVHKSIILNIITQNKVYNTESYTFHSLLKYNFTLEPYEINSMFQCKNNHTEFLSLLPSVSDIVLHDTISNFHDINAVYIFMKKVKDKSQSSTNVKTKKKKFHKKILIKKTRKHHN